MKNHAFPWRGSGGGASPARAHAAAASWRWTSSPTPAEKDIALLLLEGLSRKEIAGLRATSETTVRQQSRAIYEKAGLGGRADLAAFFLEDLLSGTRPAD